VRQIGASVQHQRKRIGRYGCSRTELDCLGRQMAGDDVQPYAIAQFSLNISNEPAPGEANARGHKSSGQQQAAAKRLIIARPIITPSILTKKQRLPLYAAHVGATRQ
jgi:hypothetical protein